MTTEWCVCSGPDESHLLNSNWFNTFKEAQEYSHNLALTPIGKLRPYKIYRYKFKSKFSPAIEYREIVKINHQKDL